MAATPDATTVPAGYRAIEGTERTLPAAAARVGAADPGEVLTVTIVLRRRPDREVPGLEHFAAAPAARHAPLSHDDFAAAYGAAPDDVARVTEFAEASGLSVVDTNAARRTVRVRGTAGQMARAFGVTLAQYEHELPGRGASPRRVERFRGREGPVHLPERVADAVVGVFGLDNRTLARRNAGAAPAAPTVAPLPIPTVARLYDYPASSAAGQTIGVLSMSGYSLADIRLMFAGLPAGYAMPEVTEVLVAGAQPHGNSGETTQDIGIAAAFAPGAAIRVFTTEPTQQGWVEALGRFAHPEPGEAHCSVLSCSWYIAAGDDPGTLAADGVTAAFVNAVSAALHDAALQGLTVCGGSGDAGTNSMVFDGKAHVQYPASDPWVLSVGGTTIANVNGSAFDEYVWNDPAPGDAMQWGTTGGGVSGFFTSVPPYQASVRVPPSLNGGHAGRGVPDVAGNANIHSGYAGLYLNGTPMVGNGTSASAPQWAGLIAVLNAALGKNVGFVNPLLYRIGSRGFRDIVPPPGPVDNGNCGVPGYPAGRGWDPCTGWGSPRGTALLDALRALLAEDAAGQPDGGPA
jgi:kumamolisin